LYEAFDVVLGTTKQPTTAAVGGVMVPGCHLVAKSALQRGEQLVAETMPLYSPFHDQRLS
jgi:hypothetical protein